MNTTSEDFKSTHFAHRELTRIIGEPSLASLLTIRQEIKANAQTVHSSLGGGAHGHLGLVLTQQVYATIPGGEDYIRPNLPVLEVLQADTQFILAEKRHQFAIDMQSFRETNAVERAIIQQIITAVEPKYLKAIKSKATGNITKTIPQILLHLFDTYGDITPKQLSDLKSNVEDMVFDPTEPVDTIFTELDDLADIAEMADKPFTEKQKIDVGYIVLQGTMKFGSGLGSWDKKVSRSEQARAAGLPAAESNYDAFQQHFRNEQKSLRKTGQLTIGETLNKNDLLNLVQDGIQEGIDLAMAAKETASQDATEVQEDTATPNEKILMAQIEEMKNAFQKLESERQQMPNNWQQPQVPPYWHPMMSMPPNMWQNAHNAAPPAPPIPPVPPNGRKHFRYCWSCGACDHWGKRCPTKKTGHQNKASFKNKLGGNTLNCYK